MKDLDAQIDVLTTSLMETREILAELLEDLKKLNELYAKEIEKL